MLALWWIDRWIDCLQAATSCKIIPICLSCESSLCCVGLAFDVVTYRRWARALCACLMLTSAPQPPLYANPSWLERSLSTATATATTSSSTVDAHSAPSASTAPSLTQRSAIRTSKAARLLRASAVPVASPTSDTDSAECDPLEALFEGRACDSADLLVRRACLHLLVDRRRPDGNFAAERDRWLRREFNAIRYAASNTYTCCLIRSLLYSF